MQKKFISVVAALSIGAAAATMVSAELNYTNARPTDTQVVDFNEAEIGSITNASTITVRYTNDGAVRTNQNKYDKTAESGTSPEIKGGVFGKTADDKIFYAPRTNGDASKTTSMRVEFNGSANGSWIKGYAEGDKIKQSVQIAFDKNTPDSYTYNLQLTGTIDGQNSTATVGINNGSTTVFAAKKNSVIFFGKTYPMNLIDSKWYNVEIVYTVGSDSTKNNAKLYIDGKYIASADFTLSKDKTVCGPMFGITQIRNNITFVDGANALPGGNFATGIGHYFDNMDAAAKRVLKHAGCKEGIAWVQYMHDEASNKDYLIEMGYRLTGPCIFIPLSQVTHFDAAKWLVDCALGRQHTAQDLPKGISWPLTSCACSYMVWTNRAGTLSELQGLDVIEKIPGIYIIKNNISVGDSISAYSQICKILFNAKDCDEMCETIEKINRMLKVLDSDGNDMMIHYTDFETLKANYDLSLTRK